MTAMQLVESKTLGTAVASIEFTSIPQNGTDLVLLGSARNTATAADTILFSFNSSTANFSAKFLQGSGSASSSSTIARFAATAVGGTETASTFSNFQIHIPNYSGSTNKSYSTDTVTENNATQAFQTLISGLWSDTSAITSITLTTNSGNLAVGSTISLYKITKGSDGIVTTS
jgi:hypothetical protein